ncbi:hypothetical protein [Paenibacillus thiaminolyticus]|uniref:hypothetical protein n=1 Tax=Paenibacillus thiaminolyticus TaxID=49283 RepID=UPI002175FC48|nr:hypothetical protein [Paenibacillus thiaminolyticus]
MHYRPLGGRAHGDDPRPPWRTVRRARSWRGTIALSDVAADAKPFYASLLERVMAFFQIRDPDVPLAETLELIAFLEAANASLAENRTVRLP